MSDVKRRPDALARQTRSRDESLYPLGQDRWAKKLAGLGPRELSGLLAATAAASIDVIEERDGLAQELSQAKKVVRDAQNMFEAAQAHGDWRDSVRRYMDLYKAGKLSAEAVLFELEYRTTGRRPYSHPPILNASELPIGALGTDTPRTVHVLGLPTVEAPAVIPSGVDGPIASALVALGSAVASAAAEGLRADVLSSAHAHFVTVHGDAHNEVTVQIPRDADAPAYVAPIPEPAAPRPPRELPDEVAKIAPFEPSELAAGWAACWDAHTAYLSAVRDGAPCNEPDAVRVYRFETRIERGVLSGVFFATAAEVEAAMGEELVFGDVLGKHSDIALVLRPHHVEELRVSGAGREALLDLPGGEYADPGALVGYNPLMYIGE